ncbi:hypothetical protein EVAR_24955_1 [Eumeta japonica]|uniref:Uncharacterized protein n=1 Tax=Eumeta variegata TaxID=151549 RepID=A0A4C1ZUW9_EUMVA|nr:hypothetical protein EVAR_24955_1 [Eumeta japonica]
MNTSSVINRNPWLSSAESTFKPSVRDFTIVSAPTVVDTMPSVFCPKVDRHFLQRLISGALPNAAAVFATRAGAGAKCRERPKIGARTLTRPERRLRRPRVWRKRAADF